MPGSDWKSMTDARHRPHRRTNEPRDLVADALRSLAADEPVRLRVSGQCMEPLIPENGEIVVAAGRRYWPGDILAFRSTAGELRVHRLVGYVLRGSRLFLQMRADASGTIDQPVGSEQIIGKVVGTPDPYAVPLAGRVAAVGRFARLLVSRVIRG